MVVDLHQGSYNRAAKWLLSSMGWSIMPHPCLLTELKDAVGAGGRSKFSSNEGQSFK